MTETRSSLLSKALTCLLVGSGIFFLAIVAGLFFPIPFLSSAAPGLAVFITYLLLVSLLFAILALWRFARRPSFFRAVAAGSLALCLLGYGSALGQQLSVASSNDIAIAPSKLLVFSDNTAPDERSTYTTFDGLQQNLAIWKPKESQEKAPVILWIHGGGWINGSEELTLHTRWLADQGYLVVSAAYPLSNENDHLWDITENRLAGALAWVRDNAAAYGADSSKIALAGDSAGGNLALQVAYRANAHTLGGIEGEIPQISAVSTLYPVADPADFYRNDDPLMGAAALQMAASYTGSSPEEAADRYSAITPANHISKATPPTLAVSGATDHLVPQEPTADLIAKLHAEGIDARQIVVPYGEHVFDGAVGNVGSQIWRQATLKWFSEHGLAPVG